MPFSAGKAVIPFPFRYIFGLVCNITIFVTMKKDVIAVICSVFALLAGSLSARAQVPPELETYQQQAGDRSILYRGKQGARYLVLANGHPYWSTTAFQRGDVLFEGNLYPNVPINIDALAQRVLVQLEDGPFTVALTPDLTPSFTMGGSRFVGFGPGESLPEGFYEVFGEGPELVYKHVIKLMNSNTQNVNGDIIGYYDENYRSDVTRHFAIRKLYYFRDAEGNFTRFKSRSALIRKFPDRKRQIRQAVNAASQHSDLDFDQFCKLVLNTVSQ